MKILRNQIKLSKFTDRSKSSNNSVKIIEFFEVCSDGVMLVPVKVGSYWYDHDHDHDQIAPCEFPWGSSY